MNIEKYFSKNQKKNVTIGIEAEFYLYDRLEQRLLNSMDIINKILAKLPKTITRDYYTYQLEVRTNPHHNTKDLVDEFVKNVKLCEKVCKEYDVQIIPLSWLGGNEMYNGLHIHLRNGHRSCFGNTMFNMYPFVLALTDMFKFSPIDNNMISTRFRDSRHFQMPDLSHIENTNRYSDIAVNRHKENTRHRMKTDNTIEIRTFDIPYNMDYMVNLIEILFNLFSYVVSNKKIGFPTKDEIVKAGGLGSGLSPLYCKLEDTRTEIQHSKMGYNYVLDMHNIEVYKGLCKKLKIEPLKVPYYTIEREYNIGHFTDNRTIKNFLGDKYGK